MTTDPLTLANQAVPQVIKWTESAKSGLEHSYPLPPGGVDELVQVTRDAMEVHFHISTAVQGQQGGLFSQVYLAASV